nr:outer membrane beta-barrel protein [uncultured Desulfuromonas sp.]
MKKFLVFLVVDVLLLFAVTAFAESGPYCSLKLGGGWVDELDERVSETTAVQYDFDGGVALAVVAGYDFSPIRIDAELGWQKNELSDAKLMYYGEKYHYDVDGDILNYSFLMNAYYDVKNGSPVSIILGVGAGTVYIETKDVQIDKIKDDDDWYFAYQVTAGLGYELNKKVTLEATYRYLDTDDEYTMHNVFAGLRYHF